MYRFSSNCRAKSKEKKQLSATLTTVETSHADTGLFLMHQQKMFSQELKEYCVALRKLNNKQRKVVMLLLLFKLSSQVPFVSFFFLSISILSLLSFSIFFLLPFLISLSLSTIPSFSSDQFSVLLRKILKVSFSLVYLAKCH